MQNHKIMMISVVIPTCDRPFSLKSCLELLSPSIQGLSSDQYEVIVSDDSKDDQSRQLINRQFSWIKWVKGARKGPAANRNFGARNAKGLWLLFIDDDCLPGENLVREYQKAIREHPHSLVFEGSIYPDKEQDSFIQEAPVNTSGGYLWSCNFMVQKQFFEKTLKGFDENFPHPCMEDVDFHYRLLKLGLDIPFIREAAVIHPWRIQSSLSSITIKRFRSTLYFLRKHPEKRNEINSWYYAKAFYNDLIKNVLPKAIKYRFKGVRARIIYDFLQLYFALFLLFYPNGTRPFFKKN